MMTIAEALVHGESVLAKSGVAEPRLEASSLLGLAIGKDRTFFYAYPEHTLSEAEIEQFNNVLGRRSTREPLQYIRGFQEFFGLEFEVSPDVLIPRPETETIVEEAISLLRPGGRVCEVGSGSGCIIISIIANRTDATGMALDLSPGAIAMTKKNAVRHAVIDRLSTLESDIYDSIPSGESFEMIVSNPPYIPSADIAGLQPEVRDHEPHSALTDGSDGLSIIRRLVDDAPAYLSPGGYLIIEIGYGQSATVRAMFSEAVWNPPDLLPDLQGIPRIVEARLR